MEGRGMSEGQFNELSPAEAERLFVLCEELGEAQQAIGKILRHGYESYNPTVPEGERISNRLALALELGDINYAVNELAFFGDVSAGEIVSQANRKSKKIEKYLHHSQR
jgi:hypothetical protein